MAYPGSTTFPGSSTFPGAAPATPSGPLAATLPPLGAALAGTVTPVVAVASSATLPPLGAASAGTVTTLARAAAGLPPLGIAATADVVALAQMVAALPPLGAAADVSIAGGATGALATTLPPLGALATADVTIAVPASLTAALPPLGAEVGGLVLQPVSGAVAGSLPPLGARLAEIPPENLLSAHSSTRTASHAAAPYVADPISAHSSITTSSHLGAAVELEFISAHSSTSTTSRVRLPLDLTLDPVTELPQFRLLVVDRLGSVIDEVPRVRFGDRVGQLKDGNGSLRFTIAKSNPKAALLSAGVEVQVWAGDTFLPEDGWFVIVGDPADGGSDLTFTCEGIGSLLDNVVIGRPRPELLRNGGFEQRMKHWHPVWFAGSAAEAPPDVQIVTGAQALSGGKAMRTTAVEKVVVKEVKTAAIFYGNRPYAWEALAAGYLPGGEQLIRDQVKDFAKGIAITVEGYTADVDGGDGIELSKRRANAAKATIHAYRPDLVVTAIGRGESVQVAPNNTPANQAKNRRIVITGSATRIGHRQAVNQFFTFANPGRIPVGLDLSAWVNLIDYVGPSKDGWLIYINRRHITAPKKILDEVSVSIPETFPKQRWTPVSCSITSPPLSTDLYEVRLYGTAGETIFDEVSCQPNIVTGFYNVTRPQLFAGLVQHAQDPAFGKVNLNIGTNCRAFGVRDDYEYEHKRYRVVGEAIAEQLHADDSPDFGIVTTATRRTATTWARRGRRSSVHLELGGVVDDYTTGGDIAQLATTAIETSNIDGGAVLEARATGPLVNGLVLERVEATEPNRTTAYLRQRATTRIKYLRTSITSVTCSPKATMALLGQVRLGDVCPVTIRDGKVNVVDVPHRVVTIRHSMATNRLAFDLVQEV